MIVRILNAQLLIASRFVQVLICRDKKKVMNASRDEFSLNGKGTRELDSIVSAQPSPFSKLNSSLDDIGCYVNRVKSCREIVLDRGKDTISIMPRNGAKASTTDKGRVVS